MSKRYSTNKESSCLTSEESSHGKFNSLSSLNSPALMNSLASEFAGVSLSDQSLGNMSSINSTADLCKNNAMCSIELNAPDRCSFPLIDENEQIMVKSSHDLMKKMRCYNQKNIQVKVVSIFGNTGEGKSYTLNHTFFDGKEVFRTCSSQSSCTLGVWAAYDESTKCLILDTEGMLGINPNPKQRKRLLLKVLAISDLIIYRTRSERLHTDMYNFIAEASRAYTKYFKEDLEEVSRRAHCDLLLGPPLYIFHDTKNLDVLANGEQEKGISPEEHLRQNFMKLSLTIDGFKSVHYYGQKAPDGLINYSKFRNIIRTKLMDNSVRSPRSPTIILNMLEMLNNRFSGKITSREPAFPDEYFTCTSICSACNTRCSLFMNHTSHDSPKKQHSAVQPCQYNYKLDNKIFICLICARQGERRIVIPKTSSAKDNTWLGLAKYAWSGYVLECDKCGIIYRSRQYWYGNSEPDKSVVRVEYEHIWPGSVVGGTTYAGRQVLEGVAALGSAISTISAPPTRMLTSWLNDQVNPEYWRPNHECRVCFNCCTPLETIHHCRKCGEGFCDDCSSKTMLVPERGWGDTPVRVCDNCFRNQETESGTEVQCEDSSVMARQISESITGTLSSVAKYPIGLLKDTTRPVYWVPDEHITECSLCKQCFGARLKLHHCRACGEGICDSCSQHKQPVKERGWDQPVRVCDRCVSSE